MSIVIKVLSHLFLISLLISCGKATKDDTETGFERSREDTTQIHEFINFLYQPLIERDTIVFLVEESVFDWRGKLPESSMIGMRSLYHWDKFQQNSNRFSTREKDMSVLDVFSGEDEFQMVLQKSFDKYTFEKSYLSSGIQLLEKEYVLQVPLAQIDSLKDGKIASLEYYETSKPVFFGEEDRFCFLYRSNAFYSSGIGSGSNAISIYERTDQGWNEVVTFGLMMY
ncbi:hypothetical protein [Mongoliitalea daihaiensis]|uniref:hypothetical protein n=1 Tax=Mongoliitalea daihaiensis TaxID=2782006 RepID=UPI001F409958|nr:hypothetical protein [Mongoliitalea daihaiensis]UJP66440.1 hypothetical protein IPZ59_07520 [Mongoliitalea daihaiensis]